MPEKFMSTSSTPGRTFPLLVSSTARERETTHR